MKALLYLSLFLFPFVCKGDTLDSYKIKTDKRGNVYILAAYSGRVTVGPFSFGDSLSYGFVVKTGYFIAKFTPNGSVLWADSIIGIETGCMGTCPGYVGL